MPDVLEVIDSHTGGEPTRIIVDGGPSLGSAALRDRLVQMRENHDRIRTAVVTEPRGSEVLVGGLLTPPVDPDCAAGILFFNNHGYLGMCGHGMIGLMATLKWLGKIEDGVHRIETPVGQVVTEVQGHRTTLQNVPSYRRHRDLQVDVPGYGTVTGDVAWGGNWFFLVRNVSESIDAANVKALTELSLDIRTALDNAGITGADGAWIDHIELFGPPRDPANHSRSFVLCPGGAYDRSPCGTGTSAKLACLAADGKLQPGRIWRQESVIGSVFEGSWQPARQTIENQPAVIPTISGTAFVTGSSQLVLQPEDPFCWGIPS